MKINLMYLLDLLKMDVEMNVQNSLLYLIEIQWDSILNENTGMWAFQISVII